MEQIRKVFSPFIGQSVWQVRRGHGSFLTMEFGMPHLSIREPIIPSPNRSEKVSRILQRRHVTVIGDWHFWVQYGDWKLLTADGALKSDDPPGSALDECLGDLEGQRLLSVDVDKASNSWTLAFDLGASLKIWPSAEIPDDLWSLYAWNGDIISCENDGKLVIEKRSAPAGQ